MAAPSGKGPATYSIEREERGFALCLNGKVMTTPAGNRVIVPTQKLAESLKEEWKAQSEKINLLSMPLTQLAFTALDIIPKERSKIIDQLSAYTDSELLCHRAEQPDALVKRQSLVWQPLLDWCGDRFDALLKIGTGIMPIPQLLEAKTALGQAIALCTDFRLAGLQSAVHESGSLVLGLALREERLTADMVFEAAELDATFQIEQWGDDPATANRREALRRSLRAYEVWFVLLK